MEDYHGLWPGNEMVEIGCVRWSYEPFIRRERRVKDVAPYEWILRGKHCACGARSFGSLRSLRMTGRARDDRKGSG